MSVATQDAPRAPKSMLQSDNTSSLRRGTVAAGSSSSSSRRGESAERSSVKGPHPSSEKGKNSLAKVPCKFFRAGACTNTDCPFLHQEQGTPKQICPWYQSNNCKFGSKCALAHVLPGQPMSMDRKNKRAQQLAQREADAQTTNSPTSPPITPEKTPSKSSEPFSSAPHEPLQVTKRQAGFLPLPAQPATAAIHSESIMAANPTSGATAAVNAKSVWGPNMNPAIKQAPSQSNGPSRQVGFAPASATTASENSEVSSTYASKASTTLSPASSSSPDLHTQQQQANVALGQSPRGLIMDYMLSGQRNTASSPRQPELFAGAADFRPSVSPALRSPPPTTAWPTSVAPASTQRHASGALDMPQSMPTNGTHAFGTSPFSNPGQRSIFLQPSSFGSDDNHLELMFDSKNSKESTPHKAADPWMKGGWDKPASFGGFRATRSSTSSAAQEVLDSFEDEEDEERIEEDFLPSSLHDLLTPEELQRAHRNQQQQQQQQQSHNKLAPQQHHNSLFDISLSRSVPADQAWKQPNGGHDGGAQMDFTVEQQQPAKDDFVNLPDGASPARRHTLLSHAPGSSLPPGLASGMSRLHLQPTQASRANDVPPTSSSPWNGMSSASPSRPLAAPQRPRRTSHGSSAATSNMFVGSPLAQAWTRVEEEDDEFPKPAAVRPSMTQHPSIHAGLSQTQSAHSLPEVDDEGLPFSMD